MNNSTSIILTCLSIILLLLAFIYRKKLIGWFSDFISIIFAIFMIVSKPKHKRIVIPKRSMTILDIFACSGSEPMISDGFQPTMTSPRPNHMESIETFNGPFKFKNPETGTMVEMDRPTFLGFLSKHYNSKEHFWITPSGSGSGFKEDFDTLPDGFRTFVDNYVTNYYTNQQARRLYQQEYELQRIIQWKYYFAEKMLEQSNKANEKLNQQILEAEKNSLLSNLAASTMYSMNAMKHE